MFYLSFNSKCFILPVLSHAFIVTFVPGRHSILDTK